MKSQVIVTGVSWKPNNILAVKQQLQIVNTAGKTLKIEKTPIFSHLDSWASQIVLKDIIVFSQNRATVHGRANPAAAVEIYFFLTQKPPFLGWGWFVLVSFMLFFISGGTVSSLQVKVYPSTFPCLAGDCWRQGFSRVFSPSWSLLLQGTPAPGLQCSFPLCLAGSKGKGRAFIPVLFLLQEGPDFR